MVRGLYRLRRYSQLAMTTRESRLRDCQGSSLFAAITLVIFPGKYQFAGFGCNDKERKIGIGGYRGMQLGTEYFFACIGASECFDNMARNCFAGIIEAKTRLHRMYR